jgi:hypothetical protein
MSVLTRCHREWANPQLHVAHFSTGEQPTWEERDCGQHVVLELLDKNGLNNRDLITGRSEMVAEEGLRHQEVGGGALSGQR